MSERDWLVGTPLVKADLLEHVDHELLIVRAWEGDPEETIDLTCVTCENRVLAFIQRRKP